MGWMVYLRIYYIHGQCANQRPRVAYKTFMELSTENESHKRVCMSLQVDDATNVLASPPVALEVPEQSLTSEKSRQPQAKEKC